MKALTDALSSTPSGAKADLAEIYRYLAEDSQKLGDAAKAKSLLEKGIALDPNGPYAVEMKDLLRSKMN